MNSPIGPYRPYGECLRAARRRARLTQQELADRVGIKQATVSGYETGIYIPALDTADRLARALGVTLNDLVPPCDTEEPTDGCD